jgi:hypothetical protein
MDPVELPDLTDQLEGELEHMDYDLSEINQYSKVDFGLLRLTVGMDYRFTSLWKGTFDVTYADLSDDAPYVYGNESGSYWVARAAARMNF